MREKDSSRKYTDKELEEIEKKLREIYSRAEKELTEKANDYFKKFASLAFAYKLQFFQYKL